MCLNFTANSFVFGSTNRDIALRTFYIKHAKRKRQKCIWTSQQISLFLAPKKSRKCAQNFFCKPHKARTSKMRLNFTANSFVFGHKYLENAPRTFFLTCKVKTSKMRLNVASDWAIYRRHSQLRQSCCPNLSCDQFSQSCLVDGKIAPGVYIMPYKIIVTREIIFFVYVTWITNAL